MNKGVHLTINGLQQVINIRASMNTGLSEIIKSEFSNNINPVKKQKKEELFNLILYQTHNGLQDS
jgi:hypothetical protein